MQARDLWTALQNSARCVFFAPVGSG